MILELVFLNFLVPSIFGLLLGNYTTTAYHRIPLNKPLNGISKRYGIKPHCSSCNHLLKFYEYLPLLSWFSTRFKCNYCGKPTDMAYFLLEIFGMLTAVVVSFFVHLGEKYVILVSIWVVSFLIIMLYLKYKKIYLSVTVFWLVLLTLTALL